MTEVKTKTAPKQRSYFIKDKVNRYFLDDGESFIEHKQLDEGLFQAYQDLTSRIKLDASGESTEVDMALGAQRRFLQDNLVTNWNLTDEEGNPVKYSIGKLRELPPEIISGLMQDIYKKNKILSGDDENEDAEGKVVKKKN